MSEHDKPHAAQAGWHLLSTNYPFKTPWMTLRQDRVRLDRNGEIDFAYLDNPPAVGVVPITRDGKLVLIKEYRYTVDDWCMEVPAGGTHDTEKAPLEEVARKELEEEIGAICGTLLYVTFFYLAVGSSSQAFHVFLALDVEMHRQQRLEVTESIEIHPTPIAQALQLARSGQMKDGSSALSILLCENLLKEHGYI